MAGEVVGLKKDLLAEVYGTERRGGIVRLQGKLRTLRSECVAGCGRLLGKSTEVSN